METYTGLKELVENPHYQEQKQKILNGITYETIDLPIVDLVKGFNKLPFCFTLQSCYGHFLYKGQRDIYNLQPLPEMNATARVEYRIAYLALCIEHSPGGKELFESLNAVTDIDPENVQFFCAEWFWERQVNSYALQVEPDRFKHEDEAALEYQEALYIEEVRREFFARLFELLGGAKEI